MENETYKIELIEIGRTDHSEVIEMNFMTEALAEHYALEEAKKYLLSSDVWAEFDEEQDCFIVFAGFRSVGKIKITKLVHIQNAKRS